MAHYTLTVVLIPAPLAGTAVVYPKGLFILQCVAAATFAFISLILIVFVSLFLSRALICRALKCD